MAPNRLTDAEILRVEVILVGGLAAQAHGAARLTQDADLIYGRNDEHRQLLPHSFELIVFGRTLRVLDLPALIRAKRAAGRPKDLEAVAELEALLVDG